MVNESNKEQRFILAQFKWWGAWVAGPEVSGDWGVWSLIWQETEVAGG